MRFDVRSLMFAAVLGVRSALGAGLPEPGVVLYGAVHNDLQNTRVTVGTLECVLQPTGNGAPVFATVPLSNILDQFSFAMILPAEAPLPGETVSSNTVELATIPATYDLMQILVDGQPATVDSGSPSTLSLDSSDRGRFILVDLHVSTAAVDSDQNGLPDDWELAHFGQLGANPEMDHDLDGMTAWQEWKAGTDPMNAASRFQFVDLQIQPGVGITISWPSVAGRSYAIHRTESLFDSFVPLVSGLSATEPVNDFLDSSATGDGPYFYQVIVED